MGNATLEQADWSGGIYRGRKAPANAVYDALNALIDDEGQLFKRGGSTFLSASNAGSNLLGLAVADLVAGSRVFGWNGLTLYALNGTSPVTVSGAQIDGTRSWARGGAQAGVMYLPCGGRSLVGYGGSLRTAANYSTGTVTTTVGSTTVTGTGTAWATNVNVGDLIDIPSTFFGAVAAVTDDTHIEVAVPVPVAITGQGYTVAGKRSATDNGTPNNRPIGKALPTTGDNFITGLFQKLWHGSGRRIAVSDVNVPFFQDASYHELPAGTTITGIDVSNNLVVVFTTQGVWAIVNGELDLVDDFGNVQQSVRQVNNIVLWGDSGIARFEGSLVVPAMDAAYLMDAGGAVEPVSGDVWNEKIQPLYRSYVKAGYQPGTAAVHRAHYFLPILNGTTLVDVLVARLDKGVWIRRHMVPGVWTRWSGHAASAAYATQVGISTRAPKLYGLDAQRFTGLTDTLDGPSSHSTDADGTTPTFQIDTVDFDTGPGIRPNTTEKVRTVYEMAGTTPTITASYATGLEGASYTAVTLKRGGGASDGTDWSAWRVGKKAERIRFRFSSSSTVTSLIFRRLELTVRQAAQT